MKHGISLDNIRAMSDGEIEEYFAVLQVFDEKEMESMRK